MRNSERILSFNGLYSPILVLYPYLSHPIRYPAPLARCSLTKFINALTNVPKMGRRPAVFYSELGLNINRISELYLVSRTISFASTIYQGDTRGDNALKAKIDRELKSKKIINYETTKYI